MFSYFLKNKIHRATLNFVKLDYEGSITIGGKLLKASGLTPFERVDVLNINNGERLTTYVIKGSEDGNEIGLNGAAARKGCPGDKVIICSYAGVSVESESPPVPVIIQIRDTNNSF